MKNNPVRFSIFHRIFLFLLLVAAGCQIQNTPQGVEQASRTQTPSLIKPLATILPVKPAAQVVKELSAPSPLFLWIDPRLPAALIEELQLPENILITRDNNSAHLRLTVGEGRLLSQWIYALVVPFPTITDEVSAEDLRNLWENGTGGSFGDQPLLMDEGTFQTLSAYWGDAADGAVDIVETDRILEEAWRLRTARAVIPFEELQPRWKVLRVNGISPVHNDFNPAEYALAVPVSLIGEPEILDAYPDLQNQIEFSGILAGGNRDPKKLTVLAMTGVTAMVRATAHAMERKGITYPAEDIRDWLRQADITHISNEVPFAENCAYPNPLQVGLFFCSKPGYIGLMEDVGTDIVELTGDHFADYGPQAMVNTLDLYRQHGWPYYGGGANLEEGRRPITLEHNGNKLAFIGCNAKGGGFATASEDTPGAVYCDFPYMQAEIQRLQSDGYIPIATFQHFEYYTYAAVPPQPRDFKALSDAGALIVSGSQAHHPQAMEFSGDSFIHYGLGNLFFDQFDVSLGTRQGFIDRHIFYNGKYISTELLGILFIDYARPRPMTEDERQQLLSAVFSASGW